MSAFQPLPAVSGIELDDLPFTDAIEQAYQYLEEAERHFVGGSRLAGMYVLGKAVRLLEELACGVEDAE